MLPPISPASFAARGVLGARCGALAATSRLRPCEQRTVARRSARRLLGSLLSQPSNAAAHLAGQLRRSRRSRRSLRRSGCHFAPAALRAANRGSPICTAIARQPPKPAEQCCRTSRRPASPLAAFSALAAALWLPLRACGLASSEPWLADLHGDCSAAS